MIIEETFWRDIFRLFVWFPLRWVSPRVPLTASLRFFRLMGLTLYLAAEKKRSVVLENMSRTLSHLYPERIIRDHARKYFQQHIINSLFPFVVTRLTPEYLREMVVVEGLEILEESLSRKRGCILIQGHVGPVQFPLVYLREKGYHPGQIYYRHVQGLSVIGKSIQLKYREKIEQKLGAEMFAVNSYQRPIYRWLKSNHIILVSGDGIGGLEFVGYYRPFPFLGSQMLFPVGPYRLSLRLGTPLLPIYVSLIGDRFKLTILPPLQTRAGSTGVDAVNDLVMEFIALLEAQIRQAPGTWHFWDGFSKGLLIPSDDCRHMDRDATPREESDS